MPRPRFATFTAIAICSLVTGACLPAEEEPGVVSAAVEGDRIKPTASVTSPINGDELSAQGSGVDVLVTGTASDAESGVLRVDVRHTITPEAEGQGGSGLSPYALATNGSGNWSSWSYTAHLTEEGLNTIVVRVTDNAANVRWITLTVNVVFSTPQPDTTKPFVNIVTPVDHETFAGPDDGVPVEVEGTAYDNGSDVDRVEVKTDAEGAQYVVATPVQPGDWSAWSHTLVFTEPGEHTIIARATDGAGNQRWFSTPIIVQFQCASASGIAASETTGNNGVCPAHAPNCAPCDIDAKCWAHDPQYPTWQVACCRNLAVRPDGTTQWVSTLGGTACPAPYSAP